MRSLPPSIVLTEQEQVLLAKVEGFKLPQPHDYDRNVGILDAAAELAQALLRRRAIPEVRLRYFTDPGFNPGGRGKSRKDIFEKNGTSGNEIFLHPHFLEYLRYFIEGPDLPQDVIDRFCKVALASPYIDSDDVGDLQKLAKEAVRSYRFEPAAVAEEFHKLALECGAVDFHAKSIYDSVRKLRPVSK